MPDITKAQFVALVQAVLAVCVAFGADVTKDQQDALMQLAGVLGGALVIADAIIRNGRSKVLVQREHHDYMNGR
jgi:hypothetical protein